MKLERHARILDIIGSQHVETQEELAELLNEAGFKVTQATVSRDIRQLRLTKVSGKNGRSYYAIMGNVDTKKYDKYVRVLKDGFIWMDRAVNIIVIKTVEGMAMAVAAALDHLQMEEMVGCIAGDDTVFCAIRSEEDTLRVMNQIRSLV